MNADRLRPGRKHLGPVPTLCGLAGLIVSTGCCGGPQQLHLRGLPGLVPIHRVFAPAVVALAPETGAAAGPEMEVGAIYDSHGKIMRRLFVSKFGVFALKSLARALAAAGLKPLYLRAPPPNGKPSAVAQYLITFELEQLEVNKRFGARATVHGQYFTMRSRVEFRATVLDRSGTAICMVEVNGAEDEPPEPVGNEEFLPLETSPDESLSVAVERAIGAFVTNPKVVGIFALAKN